jgi:hypothetical protein
LFVRNFNIPLFVLDVKKPQHFSYYECFLEGKEKCRFAKVTWRVAFKSLIKPMD